jgi:hypothetical protein
LNGEGGRKVISFNAMIAGGSKSMSLPFVQHGNARVIASTWALDLSDIPRQLLRLDAAVAGINMRADIVVAHPNSLLETAAVDAEMSNRSIINLKSPKKERRAFKGRP